MIGKKSNITNQIKLKTELLKDINIALYKLEKGNFNKVLCANEVQDYVKELRIVFHRLENSIGGTDTDISVGCNKVRADLKDLLETSNDNLIGRFSDCVLSLTCDMEEITDLESGIIEEISISEDNTTKEQRAFTKKLQEITSIEQDFIKNRNRVEEEIEKIERDKNELDSKLLSQSNPRLKQNIFRQIQASLNNIATLQIKSSQYSSCYDLLNSIKIYANELISSGNLSNSELNRAKVILDINRLHDVLDDPSKLKPLLKNIELDLNKAQANVKIMDAQIGNVFNVGQESYDAMNAYQNDLIKNQANKDDISSGVSDLEEYLKKLDSENK